MRMRVLLLPAILALLGLSACAHNPRPESPEQRAERQAQALQEQQNAQTEPRSAGYTTQSDADATDERRQDDPQSEPRQTQPRPADTARAQARQQAAAVRGTVGTVVAPVRPVVTGVTGTLR